VKNRRLLIILVVFICLGTLAVLGGVLFSVRTVNVIFVNEFSFFRDEQGVLIPRAEVEAKLRENVLPVTMSRNNLFGINDDKVREAIETESEYGIRVRVPERSIRRIFPNTIEIVVRERYPVFKLQYGEGAQRMTVVTCGHLRVLDRLDEAGYKALTDVKDLWPLVVMPSQIREQIELEDLEIGAFLTDLETEGPYMDILKQVIPHFARMRELEDVVGNIFESMSFTNQGSGGGWLTLKARTPQADGAYRNTFYFVIRGAESDRLTDMLTKAWQAISMEPNRIAVFEVWEQETYQNSQGTVIVQDGIIVWIHTDFSWV